MPNRGDVTRLAGYLNDPYRQDAVIAAARGIPGPFILREIVEVTELPTHIVHRCLGRLVKKGLLRRFKVKASYTGATGGRWGKLRLIPGGRQRRVWAYSVVAGK